MIKFTKDDFDYLEEVYDINYRQDAEFVYTSVRDKNRANVLTDYVKKRISSAEKIISADRYFRKGFVVGTCHRKKRGDGKYRNNLWVWIVNEGAYYKIQSHFTKTAPYQIYIPQLELSIDYEGVSVAEIWLENFALKNYREKLLNILSRTRINRANYRLGVEFTNGENKSFPFTDKNLAIFKTLINGSDTYKAGIIKWLPRELVEERNIEKMVLSSLKELNEMIYSKLFDSYNSGVKQSYFNPPRRKPSDKKTVKKKLRKGIEPTEVNYVHDDIQDDLLRLFKKQFNHPDYGYVTKEKDFIDLKIEGENFEYLYEIKTYDQPVKCIREALGQIIYYLWTQKVPKDKEDIKLVIIGMKELDFVADKFFKFVKDKLGINIEYDSVENLLNGKKYK